MITEAAENKTVANDSAGDSSARQPAAAASTATTRKRILICDTQPVAVEGMKWLIENSGDLRVAACVSTLEAVAEVLRPGAARVAAELAALSARSAETWARETEAGETGLEAAIADCPAPPEAAPVLVDAIVIDKGLGLAPVMEFLRKHTLTSHPTPVVVWGAISEAEALRLLQAGAKGILRRTSESGTLLTCLRTVTSGGAWMEDGIFGSTDKLFNPRRSELTSREREVVELVEKGLRNRDIARMLGIQTGTVKIHLKHIFEKTGVRGRYGLAFTGLQNKGSITLAPPPHYSA